MKCFIRLITVTAVVLAAVGMFIQLIPVTGSDSSFGPDTPEPVDGGRTRATCVNATPLAYSEISNMSLIWENSTVHDGNVWMVRWSPNGMLLITVGFDGRLVLWNGSTGEVLWSVKGHNDIIRSVAWSPSGSLLATGSDDGIVRIWDAATGDLNGHLTDPTVKGSQNAHMGQVVAIDWSSDGSTMVTVSGEDAEFTNYGDNTVKLWEFPSGNHTVNLTTFTYQAMDARFSPLKPNILGVAGDNELRLYDIKTREITNLFKLNDTAHCISWSPNGSFIASGARNFFVHYFNVNTGKNIGRYYDPEFKRREIAWSPAGLYTAEAGSGEMIKIRSLKNGSVVKILLGPSAATAPGGGDTRSGENAPSARCSGNYLPSVSWSDCGRYIATGSAGTNSVVVYGDKRYDRVPPRLVSFSPTGINVPREAVISVRFSEPVSHESFTAAFSYTDLFWKWTASDGDLIRLSQGREFIFSPSERLPANATIIVNIDYSLVDTSDNKLVGNNHWGFHTLINYAPILANSYISPGSGDEDTYFNFYTSYLDQDGDAPREIHVVIDSVPYPMDHHNGTDADGYYRYRTKLSQGAHSYYFTATDGELEAVSTVGPASSLELDVEAAEENIFGFNPLHADIVGGIIIVIMILVWFKVVLAKTEKTEKKK